MVSLVGRASERHLVVVLAPPRAQRHLFLAKNPLSLAD